MRYIVLCIITSPIKSEWKVKPSISDSVFGKELSILVSVIDKILRATKEIIHQNCF